MLVVVNFMHSCLFCAVACICFLLFKTFCLCLQLEENIPHVALFGDWIKIADGSPVEPSANHSTTAAGSSQKRGPGRRGRKPSAMPEFVADDDKDISDAFVWWCGGMLSKAVFQKGILPHIVVKNSARQGKIPSLGLLCRIHSIKMIIESSMEKVVFSAFSSLPIRWF